MNRPRLVNLLDDFALGGVSRGLGVFSSAPVQAVADATTLAVPPDTLLAPRIDADIIITHFPPNWRRLVFLASLKRRNPKACILHVEHSYTRGWAAANVAAPGRFRIMLSIALRLVDHIVCVSNGQARWLREITRLPDKRVDVIYPYSENPGLDALPLPDFQSTRRLRLGAYGRFHPAKGFEQLITAYRAGAMPDMDLVIGGYGDLEPQLRALAGDTPCIHFAGKIDDVAAFVGGCDIIAIPSRWEAYGQVANEARQGGRPILVSDVDGLPEQVGDAGLIIDFSDPDAVARAFGALTPARLAAMARAGRKATQGCGPMRHQQWADLILQLTGRA